MIWHHQVSLRKASSTQVSSLTLKKKKKNRKITSSVLIFVPKGISMGQGEGGRLFLPSEGCCYLKGMSVCSAGSWGQHEDTEKPAFGPPHRTRRRRQLRFDCIFGHGKADVVS